MGDPIDSESVTKTTLFAQNNGNILNTMRNTKTLIIWLLCLTSVVFAQNGILPTSKVKIEADKPGVYISTDKLEGENAFLRINNNLKWAISVRTVGIWGDPGKVKHIELANGTKVLPLWKDRVVRINFYVEANPEQIKNKKVNVPVLDYPGGETAWIAPGNSALFQVPQSYLQKEFRLYVPINFEWEALKSITISEGVEHRVYFTNEF